MTFKKSVKMDFVFSPSLEDGDNVTRREVILIMNMDFQIFAL